MWIKDKQARLEDVGKRLDEAKEATEKNPKHHSEGRLDCSQSLYNSYLRKRDWCGSKTSRLG